MSSTPPTKHVSIDDSPIAVEIVPQHTTSPIMKQDYKKLRHQHYSRMGDVFKARIPTAPDTDSDLHTNTDAGLDSNCVCRFETEDGRLTTSTNNDDCGNQSVQISSPIPNILADYTPSSTVSKPSRQVSFND
uniref:Chorismate synthase n=1 Tax=Lygus hesperus TaxID=30085 RepID=A0A0A9WN74_LYGHE